MSRFYRILRQSSQQNFNFTYASSALQLVMLFMFWKRSDFSKIFEWCSLAFGNSPASIGGISFWSCKAYQV